MRCQDIFSIKYFFFIFHCWIYYLLKRKTEINKNKINTLFLEAFGKHLVFRQLKIDWIYHTYVVKFIKILTFFAEYMNCNVRKSISKFGRINFRRNSLFNRCSLLHSCHKGSTSEYTLERQIVEQNVLYFMCFQTNNSWRE